MKPKIFGKRKQWGGKPLLETRLFENVTKVGGCWLWKGAKSGRPPFQYGVLLWRGKVRKATHAAWESTYNETLPYGICVLHKCDNPACINPKHLFLGTRLDNAKDAKEKGRTRHGESHRCAKLTEQDVKLIRKIYKRHSKSRGSKALSEKFKVDRSTVLNVARRTTWKHV